MRTESGSGGRTSDCRADGDVSHVHAAIVERLEGVAASHVVRSIVRVALGHAGTMHVPPGGAELADFVRGPLYRRMSTVLGSETAQEILLELTDLVLSDARDGVVRRPSEPCRVVAHENEERAACDLLHAPLDESDDYPTRPRAAIPTGPFAPTRHDVPLEGATERRRERRRLVLLASASVRTRRELDRALVGSAIVLVVRDVNELFDALRAASDFVTVVAFDASAVTVLPLSFVAALPDVARTTLVVLWGFDGETERCVRSLVLDPPSWKWVSGKVALDDVAALLRSA